MFAKISLKSFLYDLIETIVFPNKLTKEIYKIHGTDYVYVYQILTDTDSTSLEFIIVCEEKSQTKDREYRDVIFEDRDFIKRFHTSHEFWSKFNVRNETTRKQLGLFEVEHIDDPVKSQLR